MADVAIIVPTLRRPDSLKRALRSLFAQTAVGDRISEIVVVDNDPSGSAAAGVEALRALAPWPLVYVHAPRPGVATARNAGLTATRASLIAFLDDDETASPGWLAALLKAQETTGAEAVFGPITGRAPEASAWLKPYLERFFGREGPERTGRIDTPYGCGNSLMVRATALPGPAPRPSTPPRTRPAERTTPCSRPCGREAADSAGRPGPWSRSSRLLTAPR
jgi:glycosyltransferase involved in cell wall biosynthesis